MVCPGIADTFREMLLTLDTGVRNGKHGFEDGTMTIDECLVLADLDGLSNLEHVGRDMAVTNNGIGDVGGMLYDGLWKRDHPPKGRSMDDLFLRALLFRPQVELEEFERHLKAEVLDMANDPAIYINRQWMGCWDCAFEPLCTAQSRGEDVEYIKRTMYTQRED